MIRKCTVNLIFVAEGESPQEVAQRALAAVAPLTVHPVVLCSIERLDEPSDEPKPDIQQQLTRDAAAQAEKLQAERDLFNRIMASPDA